MASLLPQQLFDQAAVLVPSLLLVIKFFFSNLVRQLGCHNFKFCDQLFLAQHFLFVHPVLFGEDPDDILAASDVQA
jgi:hypothetical protein